jgi:hypothetical protein
MGVRSVGIALSEGHMTEGAMVEPTPGVAHQRVHDPVEQTFTIVEPVFTMAWNACSRCRGTSVHDGME